MSSRPRLKLVDGKPVEVGTSKVDIARRRFGRLFGHEQGGNFLRHPEHVLSRWSRRADYWNLNPHLPRPPACTLHFKERA